MVFDSDILNLPLEWAEGLGNRWMRAFATLFGIIFWVIPVLVLFITPMLLWSAISGD